MEKIKIMYSDKYLAFVLDDETKARLIKTFPKIHENQVCHHITLEYDNVTQELVDRFNKKKMRCFAIQRLNNIYTECLVVSIDGLVVRPDNKFYHITMSLAEGHSAVESNNLIGYSRIEDEFKLPLKGSIQLLDKFKRKEK